MKYFLILFALLIFLTGCGEDDFDDYNYSGTILEISEITTTTLIENEDRIALFVETNEDSEMYFYINDETKLIGFDVEDLEVGDNVKIHAPYSIMQQLPPSTLAARVALAE